MTQVDNWDQEEGYVSAGLQIAFCELGATVVAGDLVGFGSAAANKVVMTLWSAVGDAVGVAIKGGVSGDRIPVAFYGVVKLANAVGGQLTVGACVIGAATNVSVTNSSGIVMTYGYVTALTGYASATTNVTYAAGFYLHANNGTGTCYRIGMALQTAATQGDEFLCLVGGYGH